MLILNKEIILLGNIDSIDDGGNIIVSDKKSTDHANLIDIIRNSINSKIKLIISTENEVE